MKKRILRIFVGLLVAIFVLGGTIWVLSVTLEDHPRLYAGKPAFDWIDQLGSHDASASNKAYEVLNTQVIPQLVDQMFHDTNDSKLKLAVVETLNGIPGVQIHCTETLGRRFAATVDLGGMGPVGKAAVPALIRSLNDPELRLHAWAVDALGKIHSSPEVVIPVLIPCLTNEDLTDEAVEALGNYGSLARDAFPKIVPLLRAKDTDTRTAARLALKQIDPEGAAKVGVK